ncbi:hypothetical protein [Blastococcus atacamensis]|uniref:hypothetical protein n=1 Tax=Blastococcus atacamensis TaxID=2070508 RepID=UPI000CEBCECD|nr:hypothetical protein [Blastococcus atacamensis]
MGAELTVGPPDIVVDFSAAWVQVGPDDDLAGWASAAAQRIWALGGGPPSRLDAEILAAEFTVLAKVAFAVPSFGALVFCPEPSRGPRACVRLMGLRYSPGIEESSIVEEFLLPAEQQLLPPEVEQSTDAGLRRIRIRQRAWSADTGRVADHIAYLFPCDEGAWALTTSLPDPHEAELMLADLDQLAASVQLQGCAVTGPVARPPQDPSPSTEARGPFAVVLPDGMVEGCLLPPSSAPAAKRSPSPT